MPPARPVVVFVDVDDTLLRSFGSKQIPMSQTVERVRALAASPNVILYCWSSGGADYAEAACRRLGIHHLFQTFLPKPNLMLDDQHPHDWRDLIVVHPNEFDPSHEAIRGRLGWSD